MKIYGLNKLTLLDFPGHMAATIFTGGCNFRCPFCHNAALVLEANCQPEISSDEVFSFLKMRTTILEGVCITGGEPTLNQTLPDFIKTVKELGYLVKLDTNGSNPSMLSELIHSGMLDYVAMDIKSSAEKYSVVSGNDTINMNSIQQSIDILMNGDVEYEFRTTVVNEFHNDEEFLRIAGWLTNNNKRKIRAYYLQNFEDNGGLICDGYHAAGEENMKSFKRILEPYCDTVEIRGL